MSCNEVYRTYFIGIRVAVLYHAEALQPITMYNPADFGSPHSDHTRQTISQSSVDIHKRRLIFPGSKSINMASLMRLLVAALSSAAGWQVSQLAWTLVSCISSQACSTVAATYHIHSRPLPRPNLPSRTSRWSGSRAAKDASSVSSAG